MSTGNVDAAAAEERKDNEEENRENLPPFKRKHEGAFGANEDLELKARNPKSAPPDLKKRNTETDEDYEERMELIAAAGRVNLHLKDQQAWSTSFMNTSKYPKDVRAAAQAELDAMLAGAEPSNELREQAFRNNDSWSPSHTKGQPTVGRAPVVDGRLFTQADLLEARLENEASKMKAVAAQLQEIENRKKKRVEVFDLESGTISIADAPAVASNSKGKKPTKPKASGTGATGGGRVTTLQHLTFLRNMAVSNANAVGDVHTKLNGMQEQLNSALDTLKNKCPHKTEGSEESHDDGAEVTGDGKGGDASSKSKDVQSYTGNTGRMNIDSPSVTFNVFSTRNHKAQPSIVSSTNGIVTEMSEAELETLTQHSEPSVTQCEDPQDAEVHLLKPCVHCIQGDPIPGTHKCTECGQHLHECCGNAAVTGPTRMCGNCHNAAQLMVEGVPSSATVTAAPEEATADVTEESEEATAADKRVELAHSQCKQLLEISSRVLQPQPRSSVKPSTEGNKGGKSKGKKGKNRAPVIMESPQDPSLKHVGGADISH